VRDLLVPGFLLQVTALGIFNLLVWFYWPLLGITP